MTDGPLAVAPSDATVVLSTYEQPAWLEKVLWGYAAQGIRGFELVVADDGSGPETRRVVDRMARETGLRLRHVWQEDRGFRKCRILNRAILAAGGRYLVFSDGDCVPRDDFVETHLRLAEAGRFLSGGAVPLPRDLSDRLGREEIRSGRAFRAGWLLARGWRPGRRLLRLLRSRHLAAALDALTPTAATFNGGNASAFREAVLAANGFDHGMGYGSEDRALGERLENLGVSGKQARHRLVCLHLAHGRPYRTEEGLRRNREILRRIREGGEVRAREGLEDLAREVDAHGSGEGPNEGRGDDADARAS